MALTALLCLEQASTLQLRDCYYVAVDHEPRSVHLFSELPFCTCSGKAKALRKLGQTAEADKIDQRLAQIRTTTMDPNQGVPSGSQNLN